MTPGAFQKSENRAPGFSKVSPTKPKGSQRAPEGKQKGAKTRQKVVRMNKVALKSSLGAFEILVCLRLVFSSK